MATTIGIPPATESKYQPAESVAHVTSTADSQPPKRERLTSLDVFRGLTIAGMLLVNNPGTWSAIYPPLEHAPWHGWTPTDVIFPFFLFIVGITTHISIGARRSRGDDDAALVKQILRRGGLIFLLGFLMSLFPFYQWGTIEGMADPSILDRIVYRWEHVRILGVLQRIGLVYIAAGLLSLKTTLKQQVVIIAALLYGYWFAMTLIPVTGTLKGVPGRYIGALLLDKPSETLAAHLDRAILGLSHIWSGSVT
ncbi:MAG TPA: heparan-alpha-glucosaminide N-acetyltransferase domain-containing protein, partial [Rhodothermia bacterium]|nr:heparan-alpha-glucosaminide N-acetyltransferase domain-containing protein [Rhodothermia bacterium]